MSRAYRIRQTVRVRDSLSRDVRAHDEICTDLEILEILPPEEMADLLRGTLKNRGFEPDDEGRMVRQTDGVTVRIDPESGEVTVSIEATSRVEVELSKEVEVGDATSSVQRERLREQLRQELEDKASHEEAEARLRVSGEMEAALGGLSEELERVVNEVTREALKQKAARVGQIKELTEDPESGSLTIKVEV